MGVAGKSHCKYDGGRRGPVLMSNRCRIIIYFGLFFFAKTTA